MIEKRYCKTCGEEFTPIRDSHRWCSSKCRDDFRNKKVKYDLLSAYSGHPPKCMCECGDHISDMAILDLHHINGDGAKHQKEIDTHSGRQYHSWIKNNGYPEGFIVLCTNCHRRQHYHGFCKGNNYDYSKERSTYLP